MSEETGDKNEILENPSRVLIAIVFGGLLLWGISALSGNSLSNIETSVPPVSTQTITTEVAVQEAKPTETPSNVIIGYVVWCWERNPQSFENCSQKIAYDRDAYKVDVTNNKIISWNPDSRNPSFSEHNSSGKDCTIVGINNWGCGNLLYNAGLIDLRFGFNNGKYFNSRYDSGIHILYVSKTQWDSINNGKPTPYDEYPKTGEVGV